MTKATPQVPAGKLALYDKLIATNPRVERKGAASAYTSMNGHMFSFLTKTGTLALRLPADERRAFLKKYGTKLCVQYGAVMKEYVEVPASLLKNTRELTTFFDISCAYIASLKPKPTTRKKKVSGRKKTTRKKTPARGTKG